MFFEVEKIITTLSAIGDGSKSYINTSRRVVDSGEYFRQLWIARHNKTRAKSDLLLHTLNDENEKSEIVKYFQEKNMIAALNLEDGEYKGTHLFLLPSSIELIELLKNNSNLSIGIDELENLVVEANNRFVIRALEETINRLQEPLLENETMSAKSAIFCWFMLLTGAISKENGFVLRIRDEDKEFDLQDEIVEYLDALSKYIYPFSYGVKRSGKPFKRGDLSNFVRRNKDIKTSFGETFNVEGSYFYFDVISDTGEVNKENLERVINTTIKRLRHFSVGQDNIVDTITESITWYRVDSPIKQAHKSSLFLGRPSEDYYPMLEHLVYETFAMDE